MNNILEQDLKYVTSRPLDWTKFIHKTVLITGATGFIGWNISQMFLYLNKTFKYNIHIILLVRNTKKSIDKFKGDLHHNLTIFDNYDLSKHILMHDIPHVDYIIHAASNASPNIFKQEPTETILVNTEGTNNLLRIAKRDNAEFLFLSTSGVYGHCDYDDYPLEEDDFGSLDCADIKNCYLESKRCGEALCMAYMYQHTVSVKIARLGINYGYGMQLDDGRSMNTFISNIINKHDFNFIGNDVERSYLYIADTLSAIFHIILKGECGQSYNITPDFETSISDLIHLMIDMYPELNLKINKTEDNKRLSVDFSRTWMNNDKLRSLGWYANFDLETGIKRTVEAYTV